MFDLAVQEFEGVPRLRDIDLAVALEFDRPRDIRKLIDRCRLDLLAFGQCATMARRPSRGGTPFDEYWLNEKQALFICTKSEARRAVEITIKMVEVFAEWRAGVAPVADALALPDDIADWLALVREMRLTHSKAAARALWAQSPLPSPCAAGVALPNDMHSLLAKFIKERCQVTGKSGDFVRSSTLRSAFCRWHSDVEIEALGPRSWSNAFRHFVSIYSDPLTGWRIWPAKRSNTGYAGLRLF